MNTKLNTLDFANIVIYRATSVNKAFFIIS